jgi:hypothetical protein
MKQNDKQTNGKINQSKPDLRSSHTMLAGDKDFQQYAVSAAAKR